MEGNEASYRSEAERRPDVCVHLCDPRAGQEGNSFAEFVLSYEGFRERDFRLIRECGI
jgi:hypothetical protein